MSLLVNAIRLYVVMFPALDVMSAFPLMAITLGNNLFSCVYGHTSKKMVSEWMGGDCRCVCYLCVTEMATIYYL